MDATVKNRIAAAVLALAGASASLLVHMKVTEGSANEAYVDRLATSKVVTICYGDTGGYKLGDYRTDQQCDELLARKLNTVYAPIVVKHVKVPLTQGEFDALVDFVYNVGGTAFAKSTLLRKLNAGDYDGAGKEFAKWYMTAGKDCRIRANKCFGIIVRRQWQAATFAS